MFFVHFCTNGTLFFQIVQKICCTKMYKYVQKCTKIYKIIYKLKDEIDIMTQLYSPQRLFVLRVEGFNDLLNGSIIKCCQNCVQLGACNGQ